MPFFIKQTFRECQVIFGKGSLLVFGLIIIKSRKWISDLTNHAIWKGNSDDAHLHFWPWVQTRGLIHNTSLHCHSLFMKFVKLKKGSLEVPKFGITWYVLTTGFWGNKNCLSLAKLNSDSQLGRLFFPPLQKKPGIMKSGLPCLFFS